MKRDEIPETTSVEETSAVDRLARETRAATEAPPVDWESVEAKLFARMKIDAEDKRRRGAHVMWLPIAGALAAAAALALLVGRGHDAPPLETPTAQAEPSAGSIVASEGDGEVLVDGRAIAKGATGTTIGAHAVVETRGGARVLVERKASADATAVAFWIEPASRIVVTRSAVRGTLVVALDRGALEAKVTPAPQGEPFAVDVGASRVAVHGTHFRVARDGSRVVVDLTEGVVSIGAPPRVGATYGELVTAPAHAEFVAENAAATLKIDHTPSAVRAAVAFAIPVAVASPPAAPVAIAPTATTPTPGSPAPPAPLVASAPKIEPAPSAQPPAATPDPQAEFTIARAVRACLAARPPAPGVKLTVSTVIELQVGDEGNVQLARFNPPLAPDMQACATAAIYRVRFTGSGAVSIPIDYKYAE